MDATQGDKPTEALVSLISPLGAVPEDKFRRVVTMLEGIRHKPEVKAALEGMRARIVQVRPPRQQTVQRVLYLPVEDALINGSDKNGCGYVSRQVMSAAWDYLERQTDPAVLREWQSRINALSGVRSDDEVALENEIWSWAAEVLGAAAARALVDRAERKALLGDSVDLLIELQQGIRLLDVGPQIRVIKDLLPLKPVRMLAREDRAPIRHLLLDLQPSSIDRVYAILLSVMLRLAVPGQFLDDIPAILSGFPGPAKAELQARLTVFVMGEMDCRATAAVRTSEVDLNLRTKNVELLVAALAAGEQTITTGDRDTRKQLTSVRATAEKLVGDIVREAEGTARMGMEAGRAVDVRALRRAEDSVSALRQCAGFAEKIGLEASVRGTLEAVTASMRERAAAIMEALHVPPASEEEGDARNDEIFWTIRMLELAGNSSEAEEIRRAAMRLMAQSQRF